MSSLEVSREIAAPAALVWSLITDLDGSAERLSGVESLERISGPEFGVGTRWRETRKMFGREATEEMEVTGVEPGSAYTVEAASHGSRYHSQLQVTPTGEATSTLTMRFAAEPQGALAKVMAATLGRLFTGATRKAIAQDLDDIAAAAEGRSA